MHVINALQDIDRYYINQSDGLVQDCSISSALAMEILQSLPLKWKFS